MSSSSSRWRGRSAHLAALLLLAAAGAAACSDSASGPIDPIEPLPDPDSEVCADSTLSYQNFAAPFVINWCRGCHAKAQPMTMRQGAPIGVNFDTDEDVRGQTARILARATGAAPTMPPVGGPSEAERALLAEWLACGAK
jgi:uncharacterized membrane protein